MLLGHTPVGAVEIDPFARAVLQARQADGSLPNFPIYEDVRDFDGTAWRDRVDIIAGGFPCQDLSCAGKGAGIDGARSGLWWEMLRVIREARPRFVFLENVPAITGRGLDRVLGSLADLGFDAEWCVLSAADVGAPHLRKRWWCLASDSSNDGHMFGPRSDTNQRPLVQTQQSTSAGKTSGGGESGGRRRSNAAVADADAGLRDRTRQQIQAGRNAAAGGCADVADANDDRRQTRRRTMGRSPEHDAAECSGPAHPDTDCWGRWDGAPGCSAGSAETQSRVGRTANGLAAWLDAGRRLHAFAWQEGWEDDCPRVVTGKPANRTNRLKALGNGQVPQTAAAAFRILWERLHR